MKDERTRKGLFGLAVILVLMAFSFEPAHAITWRSANQVTVAWDAVTQMSDGTPIPVGSTIQYQVYIRTDPTGISVASGAPLTAVQAVVTFAMEGFYDVGIECQRVVTGVTVSRSVIAWSNDPIYVQGGAAGTFGVQYYISPKAVQNLH